MREARSFGLFLLLRCKTDPMADQNSVSKHIHALTRYLVTLQDQLDEKQLNLTSMAVAELTNALEELQVAETELSQQNEALQMAQESIAQERQRYQELFEFAPEAYFVTDGAGIIREANRAAGQLFNIAQRFLVGKPLSIYVAPTWRSQFRVLLNQINSTNGQQEYELEFQPRQKQTFDAAVSVTASYTSDGKPIALRWLVRDISNRKKTEYQIQVLNLELLRRISFGETLSRIQESIRSSLDEKGILQSVVRELTHTLDLVACDTAKYDLRAKTSTVQQCYASLDPSICSSPGDLVLMSDFSEGYRQLLQGQAFQFCEITTHPVRSQMSVLACPIADHEGVLGDLWCFVPRKRSLSPEEVSLVRQVATHCAIALRQAHLYQAAQGQVERLAELNRLKDDFVSTMSHELRTPLTNMKMALHLFKVATTDEQRSRCIQILSNECDREIHLITDLLDLQQLETEAYPDFLREAVRLQEWFPTLAAPYLARIQQRHQKLTIQLAADLPPVITDQASLRRLLLELLYNAHKFTPAKGEIIVEATHDPDTACTIVTVRNLAQIPTESLPYLFDKFYRVPNSDLWNLGGTGLGLSLVQKLTDRLEGKIQVSSAEGWTTFALMLPGIGD